MSYCRFQNTLEDLEDCAEHAYDDDLSADEASARKRLLDLCMELGSVDVPENDE